VVMHYLMICAVASSLPAYFSWNIIWNWKGGSEGSLAGHGDVGRLLEDVRCLVSDLGRILILILIDWCGGVSRVRICGCRSVLILYLRCCYWRWC
jgi:hypothetical protein